MLPSLLFAAALAVHAVSAPPPLTRDTLPGDADVRDQAPRDTRDTTRDTTPRPPRKRPKAVEYSDWYARRLTIHRWASYATLPLFAAQYITGEELLKHGRDATFARHTHGPVATGVAALFGVNTVTGVWNLAEARGDPAGRTRRTLHGLLMLAADAGFVAVGQLATPAQNSAQKRQLHKQIALTSMGVSLVSYIMMLPPFRGGD